MRLRTARMTDDTLVSQIDDYVGELESDIAQILGYALDTDITESAFLVDNSGRLTKALLRFAILGGSAVQITNTTNSKKATICLRSIYLRDGTIAPVVGIAIDGGGVILGHEGEQALLGFGLVVGDGSPYWRLDGATYSNTRQGLIPKGSGNASEFYDALGRLVAPGRPSDPVLVSGAANASGQNNGLPVGTPFTMEWLTEVFDPTSIHADLDDEIIIAVAGKYRVSAQVAVVVGTIEPGRIKLKINRNRAAVITQWAETEQGAELTDGQNNIECEATIDCNVGDKLSANLSYSTDSGLPDTFGIADGYFAADREL